MSRVINKIKIFVKDNDKSRNTASILKEKLLNNNFIITDNDFDLVISIGGDGTFLKMVLETGFNKDVFYIGINSGSLGFLEDLDINDIDNFINCLNNNKLNYEELSYGKVNINNKEDYSFLNEIVIRNNNYKTVMLPIYIDDVLLEEFHGDGILISTSTGSTAYNLSNNGPIIYNKLNVLTITPLAPINNKVYKTLSNSIVIPSSKEISITSSNNKSLAIIVDGKDNKIDNVNSIKVNISKTKIKYLRMKDYNYIKLINKKIVN